MFVLPFVHISRILVCLDSEKLTNITELSVKHMKRISFVDPRS